MRCVYLVFLAGLASTTTASASERPNIVLLLADDLGYADIGCYGAEGYATPNIDRLAAEGVRLTSFYVHPICTPTRAALMSGCYPQRIGMESVNAPKHTWGIAADEELLPELLKQAGYATGIFGKWHLGHHPQYWPLEHGFDTWQGTPGSNDHRNMIPSELANRSGEPDGLVYIHDREIVDVVTDQGSLTRRSTDGAVDFIRRHQDRPFFLYVPYNMPHTPIDASDAFRGTTERGIFGDVISELDWSVGQIMETLDECGLDDNTLVLFASDNGPWLIFGDHGGSAGPFSGGKKQTLEGGVRTPCIARWPGHIPAGGTCDRLTTMMDILPTVAGFCRAPLPVRKIDGHDLRSFLLGSPSNDPPEASFFYYYKDQLEAVRLGSWKLQVPHTDQRAPDPNAIGNGGVRGPTILVDRPLALFHLPSDPAEQNDVSAANPQRVAQLQALANQARESLGDSTTGTVGREVRPVGHLADEAEKAAQK